MIQPALTDNMLLPAYEEDTRLSMYNYVLQLGDASLILGHRLSEWCGHGPILEQDMAMTNISLDLLGETRSLYQYAALLEGKERTEDEIAFLRPAVQYRNPLLVEMPNGNFADTVMRQFLFDTFHYYLLQQLKNSTDPSLAAIAEKSFKEASYHIKWSSEWVIRLGDGTAESHQKAQNALNALFAYTEELFELSACETELQKMGLLPDYSLVREQWVLHVEKIMETAGLSLPKDIFMHKGGKEGKHTEALGFILAELQYMQRAYPGCTW